MTDILTSLQTLAADAEEKYRGDIEQIADGRAVRSSDLVAAAATGRRASDLAADVGNVLGAREAVAKRQEIDALKGEIFEAQKAVEEVGRHVAEARKQAAAMVRPFAVLVDEATAREKELHQRLSDTRAELNLRLNACCLDGDATRPKWSKPRE
jgi:hypothetical protein